VLGRDAWPSEEDGQHLPYIRAIIKEVRCETRAHFVSFLNLISCVTILGGARPRAVLDAAAALFHGRLCLQRDVHPEEHGARSQPLRNPSQRGEVSGLVRTRLPPFSSRSKLTTPRQICFQT
jgi:hypothetical protein